MALPANAIPKLLILPEGQSPEARICTLAHPRTSNPSRYLFDPEKGIYEFTRVAAPKSTSRSWLIGSRGQTLGPNPSKKNAMGPEANAQSVKIVGHDEHVHGRPVSGGFVLKNAELLVATPIDSLFLLLPCLATSSANSASKGLFLSADDLLERHSENSQHLNRVISHQKLRSIVEERMEAVCDTVDAGDEKMYRLSDEKLLGELIVKAKTLVTQGLPASMEERFVRKALETPVMVVKREDSSVSEVIPSQNTPILDSAPSESLDSQISVTSAGSTMSATTDITNPDETAPSPVADNLYHLLRLRTALSYMISAYVPPTLAATLNTMLTSEKSPLDFKPLDQHLASIAKMRTEALAARSLGDFSRKRSMFEEDDAAETRLEKKRKKEEEEKKKKTGETRGIRDLKKVDTNGMKKMSDFFGKRTSPRKK